VSQNDYQRQLSILSKQVPINSGAAFSNTSSIPGANTTGGGGHQRHKTQMTGTSLPATFEIGNSKKYSIGSSSTNKNATQHMAGVGNVQQMNQTKYNWKTSTIEPPSKSTIPSTSGHNQPSSSMKMY
jgi:hypothetical protein